MSETVSSRFPGFHKLPLEERLAHLSKAYGLSREDLHRLRGEALEAETANQMIENAVGTFSLPLGLGLNLTVNGRDYVVPMAVEEPSVVAAVSLAAKIARAGGGFSAEADPAIMIGQVQICGFAGAAAVDAAKGAGVEKVGIVTEGMRRAGGASGSN